MLIPLGIWAASGASSGGPSGTDFQLISTQVLGSSASSVTFSSIPQTFKHLQLRMTARAATGGYSQGNVGIKINATTSVYSYHGLYGQGSSVNSWGYANQTNVDQLSWMPGSTATASSFGAYVMDFLDYANTTTNKTVRSLGGHVSSADKAIVLSSANYRATSAITTLEIIQTDAFQYATGSRFSLYGWN
jgi:hypothetical protein